jgi:hypothetical protein
VETLKLTTCSGASLAPGESPEAAAGRARFGRVVAEDAQQASAEAILHPGIAGVMLVEAPLDAEQALAQAGDHVAGLRGRAGSRGRADLFDGDGEFVLELDAVAQAVVDVEIGHLVGAGGGVAIADPAEVDLPMLVAGGFGIVGAKRRPALRMCCNGEEDRQSEAYRKNPSV